MSEKRHRYSEEDLKELLAYIASDPAIPFPSLSKKEREELIREVQEQLSEMKKSYMNPELVIDIIKSKSVKFEK